MPLEWTGHHKITSGTGNTLPATQGQRYSYPSAGVAGRS